MAIEWLKNHPRFAVRDRRGRSIRLGDVHQQLEALLAEYGYLKAAGNRKRARANRVSNRTWYLRCKQLHLIISELRTRHGADFPGMKVQSLHNLGLRHAEYLKRYWFSTALSGGVINNRISMLRTLYGWIDKARVIPPNGRWLTVEELDRVRRSGVALKDKTPEGAGIGPTQLIELIDAIGTDDPRVAAAMTLQRTFGMRVKESLLFRPYEDVATDHVFLSHGCKNGRSRELPEADADQIAAIERAKAAMEAGDRCLIPHAKSYQQGKSRYNNVLRKHGVTQKQLGFTSHGLRRAHLHGVYTDVTGELPPVKGGHGAPDADVETAGRQEVAKRAGHAREEIANAYLGRPGRRARDGGSK
jgi:hypothetical protein